MNPILQFQDDVLNRLLAEELLQYVNIVALRSLQVAKDLEVERAWLKLRNGRQGAGIVVGMPTLEHNVPNVPGPERKLFLPVSTFEQPSLNALATGTGLDAETIVDYHDALLARVLIEGLGCVYCEAHMPNLEAKAGVIRYDSIYVCEAARNPIVQVTIPALSAPALTVTLTNAAGFPAAAIYYTIDGSYPGRNPATGAALGTAVLYTVPFTVPSGTRVRWVACQTGYAASDVGEATIS